MNGIPLDAYYTVDISNGKVFIYAMDADAFNNRLPDVDGHENKAYDALKSAMSACGYEEIEPNVFKTAYTQIEQFEHDIFVKALAKANIHIVFNNSLGALFY